METVPFVLKTSLEKEEEEEHQQQKWCLEDEGEISIDSDWIREFMKMSDEELDKVVVLGEVSKPEAKSKSSISKLDVIRVDDDDDEEEEEDDDCVVLDCDPENLVTSVKDSPTESDELVVVGEKGQNACRDYPHPRHLCVNFPYSSNPHEKHCGQCHCYVCDSPAPCLKWGTGLSTSDHCHATDKSEMWKTLRENFKLGIQTAPLSASTNYGTLTGDVVGNSHHNHFLLLDVTRLSTNSMLMNQNQTSRSNSAHPFSVNLIPQSQASRPTITRAWSSLTSSLQNQFPRPNTVPGNSTAPNVTILHGANHGRCQELGSTLARNRYQSHSVPKQWLGVQSHAIQKARGGRGPCSLVGSVGGGSTLKMNRFTHNASGFSNHVNPAWQYDRRYHAATGLSIGRTCYGENNVWIPNANNLLYPQQPSSELTSLGYVNKYSSPSENQAFYQPSDSRSFYGYSIQGTNNALSSYVAGLNRNQHLNEHQIGNQNVNAGGNIIHCGATMQDGQNESARKAGFLAFDSSWAKNTSQNISYLQSLGSMNIPPLNAKESGTQFTVNTGLSVDDINHWLFDEDNSHS